MNGQTKCGISTMESYSTTKRNEVLIYATTWTNLKNVISSERSQSQKTTYRASLVVQWLRICLPMQGTRVQVLVWEDPTCSGATKPVRHNYLACALEPMSHNY